MGTRYDISVSVLGISKEEAETILDHMGLAACQNPKGRKFFGKRHRCKTEWVGGMHSTEYCDECGEDSPRHDIECSKLTSSIVVGEVEDITVTNLKVMNTDTSGIKIT